MLQLRTTRKTAAATSAADRTTPPSTAVQEKDEPGATARRDGFLMALTLGSGATDAICFLALGKVFSAFMTGNLVFLGLRISGTPGPVVHSILTPLCAFAVGVVCATLIVNPTRGSQVWPRRVTVALSVTAFAELCFVGLWLAVSGHPSVLVTDILLGLSALGMGVQTAAVFSLGIQGVFTTAATATLAVLMGDTAHWSNTRPDRRVLAGILAALVAGAALGGALVVHARSYAPLLPLLASSSVVVIAALAFHDTHSATQEFGRRGSRPGGVPS
jgi:uncharacterized membrane protein YoaK (UPF0700 family)